MWVSHCLIGFRDCPTGARKGSGHEMRRRVGFTSPHWFRGCSMGARKGCGHDKMRWRVGFTPPRRVSGLFDGHAEGMWQENRVEQGGAWVSRRLVQFRGCSKALWGRKRVEQGGVWVSRRLVRFLDQYPPPNPTAVLFPYPSPPSLVPLESIAHCSHPSMRGGAMVMHVGGVTWQSTRAGESDVAVEESGGKHGT